MSGISTSLTERLFGLKIEVFSGVLPEQTI